MDLDEIVIMLPMDLMTEFVILAVENIKAWTEARYAQVLHQVRFLHTLYCFFTKRLVLKVNREP